MSKVHEGWSAAHHMTPLHHDSRDNAGLPTPRDQGEGASHTDKEHQAESKYQENHKSRAAKLAEKNTHEEREALRAQFSKEDEEARSKAAPDPHGREWTKGTEKPKEHK